MARRGRLKKSERAGPLKTKSGIRMDAVRIITMSAADKRAATEKRAKRTAAIKAGAKKKAVPSNTGSLSHTTKTHLAAVKARAKAAKKAAAAKKKAMIGRDRNRGSLPEKFRKRARRTT